MSRSTDLSAVADDVWRLSRVFDRVRAKIVAETGQITDYTSMVLVVALVREGPLRSRDLAEVVLSDASTVSRQVASLVARGLVERRADPADGRSALLVATPEAHALVAEKMGHRDEHYARMLADWSAADVRTLAHLLGRLAEVHEDHMNDVLADHPTPCLPAEAGTVAPARTRDHPVRTAR